MCELLGKWDLNWARIRQDQGISNIHELVNPPANKLLGGQDENDFCAFVDLNRNQRSPYLQVIPFGTEADQVSGFVENGDLLIYLTWKGSLDSVEMLKQRGHHAEICYKNDTDIAFQAAAFMGQDHPKDRPVNQMEHGDIAHIIRPEFPFLSNETTLSLRSQVSKWKSVFNQYVFPPGDYWYLDPADFATVDELKNIAVKLLSRKIDEPTILNPVTCVQWSWTVLSLALNFPLSKGFMNSLEVPDANKAYWIDTLQLDSTVASGINQLPIYPLSPIDVIQDYLDIYANGKNAAELISTNPEIKQLVLPALAGMMSANHVGNMFNGIDISKVSIDDLEKAFISNNANISKYMLPSTFYCASRKPSKDDNKVWFRYIGTVFHNDYVIEKPA